MEWYFYLILGGLAVISFFVGLVGTLGARGMLQDYKAYGDKANLGAGIIMLVVSASMFFLTGFVIYGAIVGFE